jgi:uncharacterized SAM-binding protein YcdF (DUF218 family)
VDLSILLKQIVEIIFSPLGILVILFASGIILRITQHHFRLGQRFLTCGALCFLIILFTPLSSFLIWSLEKQYPPMLLPPESPRTNRIVVLAGYAEENPGFPITSSVSPITIGSISEGLRLYRLIPGAKLILSGGVIRRGERPVAARMAEFLQQMGVPASDIIVEGYSKNTYENLCEVEKIVGSNPFILVAQACDMMRAVAVARKLQMHSIPAPACFWALKHHRGTMTAKAPWLKFFENWDSPSMENFRRLQWAYHEYLGYLWYRLLDRI